MPRAQLGFRLHPPHPSIVVHAAAPLISAGYSAGPLDNTPFWSSFIISSYTNFHAVLMEEGRASSFFLIMKPASSGASSQDERNFNFSIINSCMIHLHSGASPHSWYFVDCVLEKNPPAGGTASVATYCPQLALATHKEKHNKTSRMTGRPRLYLSCHVMNYSVRRRLECACYPARAPLPPTARFNIG